jgi:hypothetical protein
VLLQTASVFGWPTNFDGTLKRFGGFNILPLFRDEVFSMIVVTVPRYIVPINLGSAA